MRWLPLLLLACTPAAPGRFLVVDGAAGSYDVTEAAIPELQDPYRMRGSLGNGKVGGFLELEDDAVTYGGGGNLAVDYVREGDVGVPLDADGLALGLAEGLALGLVVGLALGLVEGLALGLAEGLALGF